MMKLGNLVKGKRFLLSVMFLAVALIMVNQIVLKLMPLGITASLVYILIGGYLLGSVLFKEEQLVVLLPLGALLLLGVMSVLSWFVIFFGFHIGVLEAGAILLATCLFLLIVVSGRGIKEKMPSLRKPFGKKNPEEK